LYIVVAVNATRTTTNIDGKLNRDATHVPACRATAKRLKARAGNVDYGIPNPKISRGTK